MGELVAQRRKAFCRTWTAVLIGGAPVLMVVLPWTVTRDLANWQMFVRGHSFAIPLMQFAVVLLLMADGFSPLRAIRNLPRAIKAGISVWLLSALFASFQPGNDYVSASIGFMKLFFATLFALALVDYHKDDATRWYRQIWFSIGCGTILYAVIWGYYIAAVHPVGEEWVTNLPGFNNIRHVAFLGFAGFVSSIVCFTLVDHGKNLVWRWGVPVFFGTIGLGIILWTGSRGPMLASMICVCFILAFGTGARRKLAKFFTITLLVTVVGVSAMPIPHPIYGIYGATGVADSGAVDVDEASSGRITVWTGTVERIAQKPLLGWGLEQFATFGKTASGQFKHPHNIILQLMFSVGLVGIAALGPILFFVFGQWRNSNGSVMKLVGSSCVAAMLIYAMYDGTLYFSYPIMIFLLAVAMSTNQPVTRPVSDKLG